MFRPLLLSLFLLSISSLISQTTVSGEIKDPDGEPISGVNILQKETEFHSHSDDEGKFEIVISRSGGDLCFTHVLYKDAVHPLPTDGIINVVLTPKSNQLEAVELTSEVSTMNKILSVDLNNSAVKSSQDLLKKVPGLFIGQHAGGGKAEQIFLRGFDIDHGTDVSLSFDGMPVNMVSHAHGQGYADMHFVIPEVIQNISFGKGSYYADKGNFNTAGYVDFRSKNELNGNLLKAEYGSFNSFRTLGMFDIFHTEKQSLYIASEYIFRDGFFESSQNFSRINLLGKYQNKLSKGDVLDASVSYFDSKWSASGQIPERAVNSGLITKFGAIDDTEGGETSRINANIKKTTSLSPNTFIKNQAYISKYDFTLFSNFTFFLEDSLNGDQIKQSESRVLTGFNSTLFHSFSDSRFKLKAGIQVRNDKITDNQLANTINKTTIQDYLAFGDVNEFNGATYANVSAKLGKWTFTPGLRLDYFNFQYTNKLDSLENMNSLSKALVSPKVITTYSHSKSLQFALKMGYGFHSNDSRISALQRRDALPISRGADLEMAWKPSNKFIVNTQLWFLALDQEFVYVGDAGIVEPSGKTLREGLDVSMRYFIKNWLSVYSDFNYSFARGKSEGEYTERIPLAPEITSTGGINISRAEGFNASINYRYMGDRAANEDNSIVAKGYFILDASAGYAWKNVELNFTIENMLNSDWYETQFATESRLQFEDEPVEEIHFTPGTPFFIGSQLTLKF